MQADRYKREVSVHIPASAVCNTGGVGLKEYLSDFNPFNAKASFVQSTRAERFFIKPGKPCHVGIHLRALAEYSQADRYK